MHVCNLRTVFTPRFATQVQVYDNNAIIGLGSSLFLFRCINGKVGIRTKGISKSCQKQNANIWLVDWC